MDKKILIITNIPNPYRIPFFNELNRQLQKRGNELLIAFGAIGYKRRKWKFNLKEEAKFNYVFLKSKLISLFSDEKFLFTYGGLFNLINKFQPEIIIVTGFSVATFKLWLLSLIIRIKYVIWSGSINTKGRKDTFLRFVFRKVLIKKASGFIAYGSKAKEYLIKLGAEPEKIFISFNTTDIEYYKSQTEKIKSNLINENKFKRLLYIGHLTKGKRIDLLLKVALELKKLRNDFIIDIVGDGPERNILLLLVNSLNIKENFRFCGFKQKNEIPAYLANADLFLFPSEYDIWGLALVEAMASGLPCIASIHAGATSDIIIDGVTGYAVNFEQTDLVIEKINYLLNNPSERLKVGESAKKFIFENLTLQKGAEGFLKALNSY